MSRFKILIYASIGASVAALLTAVLIPEFVTGSDREDVTAQFGAAPPSPERIGKPSPGTLGGIVILKKEDNKYYYYEAVHTGEVRLTIVEVVGAYWLCFGAYLGWRALRRRPAPSEPLRRPHWRRSPGAKT